MKIFQVERIGHEHADAVSTDTEHLLSELRTALTMYGPVREHVKTLYFQWTLVEFSQLSSIPRCRHSSPLGAYSHSSGTVRF